VAAAAAADGVVALVLVVVAGGGGGSIIMSDKEFQPHACMFCGHVEVSCTRCGRARASCQERFGLGLADAQPAQRIQTSGLDLNLPRETPPPNPVILFSRADPPARILASRRSLRSLACSEALEGGVGGSDDVTVGVSAMAETADGDRWPEYNTLYAQLQGSKVRYLLCV
jgi:hypothetical protein